jgi:hypothetical protein
MKIGEGRIEGREKKKVQRDVEVSRDPVCERVEGDEVDR